MTYAECNKKIPCFDCTDEECVFHGRKDGDCPDIQCHRPDWVKYDCNHCKSVDRIIEELRRRSQEEEE